MPVFTGTAAADRIVGSAEADQIYGLDGDDTLYGGDGSDWLVGGLGDDTLFGGLGDDSYDVDSAGDRVVERAGEGIDRVRASVSHQLSANVEILTLTGTADIDGFGNALDNTLIGNSGNNVLNGGAGDDAMAGGTGNDVYDVDSTGDVASEGLDAGYDRVRASVSHTLSANVEELDLTGTADIDGTGNALANTIVGNAGANVLAGGAGDDVLIGGAGDDRLVGGIGNDTYDVDAAGDQVVEAAGQGIDLVRASVSYVLGANVETLTLTGLADINGGGNEGSNLIIGNAGNNGLHGGGGDDTLLGGAGSDDLTGGFGKDYVYGGDSSDTLHIGDGDLAVGEIYDGGGGNDILELGYVGSREAIDISHVNIINIEELYSLVPDIYIRTDQFEEFQSIQGGRAFVGLNVYLVDAGSLNLSSKPVLTNLNIYLSNHGNFIDLSEGGSSHRISSSVHGGSGDDVIYGNKDFTLLDGGNGNDVIHGYGKDSFVSSSLQGGGGDDQLTGGLGSDSLTGGDGADRFRFVVPSDATDTIFDFSSSEGDKLVFQGLLHGSFSYLGSGEFTATGNSEARFEDSLLLVDTDGNGSADIKINMIGTWSSSLHASDFVFS
ncbi:calcium-binding protein [Inquilinus limosus]|uniref:calcium-binding protein n=1 Tax=Inquilinus limosus TaxID=171674 RepID=UPI00068F85E1|nr:calcium-binding protein [Inquilinus limosus]